MAAEAEASNMSVERVEEPEAPGADLSGRHRLSRNVAFAWGGYMVNVCAGFIMPRLISDRLGQASLGVWDFTWSVVSYFGLVHLGLGGSVQRYVAMHRTHRNNEALSKSVSTIGLSLKVSGLLVGLVSVVAALWIVPLFQKQLGINMETARIIVLFLGLEVAISTFYTVYGGILVGCHRWDMQNTINALCYGAMTLGMIGALVMGGGLASLAIVHCAAMGSGEFVRWRLARKVCPEFVMDFRLFDWGTWREQAKFSAKGLLPRIADLISNQALALLLTASLGPAMLAVYSRPRNLMRQGQIVAARFGSILIPTASSLHAREDKTQLQGTFLNAAFFISWLTMPGVAALAIFGNALIKVWMGGTYVYPGLTLILAIGCFPSLIQEPVWCILAGMDRHGRLAWYRLCGAICSAVTLGIGLEVFHWGLVGAALAFAVPQFIVDSIVAPVIACRCLETSTASYYVSTYLKPLIGTIPFVLCLEAANQTRGKSPLLFVIAIMMATAVLAWVCWTAFSSLMKTRGKETESIDGEESKSLAADSEITEHTGPQSRLRKAKVVVVFRNDDPSALSDLQQSRDAYGIFEKFNAPQTLAIIPKVAVTDHHDPSGKGERLLTDNPEIVAYLRDYAKRSGSEIALHGLTHRTNRFSNPRHREFAEFKYLPLEEQQRMIQEGTEIIERAFGMRPVTFVPPWNRMDENTAEACARNGYVAISAGPHVADSRGLLSVGFNTDLGRFEEDFQQAKAASNRVFLTVLFHSITLTEKQKQLLEKALTSIAESKECEVATIQEVATFFPDELREVNEVARNVVALPQVPQSVRARAWPYLMAVGGKIQSHALSHLLEESRRYYLKGDYAGCRAMTKRIDGACAKILWGSRLAAVASGVGIGAVAGVVFPDKSAWLLLMALLPVAMARLVAQRATGRDTRLELNVAGALAAAGTALTTAFLLFR